MRVDGVGCNEPWGPRTNRMMCLMGPARKPETVMLLLTHASLIANNFKTSQDRPGITKVVKQFNRENKGKGIQLMSYWSRKGFGLLLAGHQVVPTPHYMIAYN